MHHLMRLLLLLALLSPAAAHAEAPSSPRAAGTGSWLGFNLTGLVDWQTQRPVIDVMKNARAWIGHLPGQWGGWEEADLIAAGALDAQGWPQRIPDEVTGISTLFLTDLPEDADGVAGTYRLTHQGRGRLELTGRVGGVRRRGLNELWFTASPGEGFVQLTLHETDPDDPIRNIEIVHLDHIAAHDAGEIFNPDWLARLNGTALFRFMDWMNTNQTQLSDWADRPRPDDYTWTRDGVPLEVMIRLANETGAEPWFTLPHLADDAFFTASAEMIHAKLDPSLRAWIEFSNETWNWSFPQAGAAREAAAARWGNPDLWQEWNAMRAARMVQAFDRVFADAPERLVRVLATQTGWHGLEDQLLARHWQAEDPGNPAPPALFDAYAITGYFSAHLGSDLKAPLVRRWLEDARAQAHGQAQGLIGATRDAHLRDTAHAALRPKLIEELRDGRHSGDPSNSVQDVITRDLPYHKAVADAWGLKLVAYEGGTHLVGNGPWRDDPDLTALFTDVNYSGGMAALYDELLNGWFRAGGAQFVHYTDIRKADHWGSFGALRHLGDDNPRWQALIGFRPEDVAR